MGPVALNLHGIGAEVPVITKSTVGASSVGKLQTAAGEIDDVVLTTQSRKKQEAIALTVRRNERLEDAALRQLAIGMLDSKPAPRACSAYAYWQATELRDAVSPVLDECLLSEDESAFQIAAHCAHKVRKSMTSVYENSFRSQTSEYRSGELRR